MKSIFFNSAKACNQSYSTSTHLQYSN